MIAHYKANKARFAQYDQCPLLLYQSGQQIVELIGNPNEDEIEFLERMERQYPEIGDVDEIFLQTIGQTRRYLK